MQEDEVIAYLQSHHEFFEKNASLLADIHLPSPHGNGTISLAERQQLAQRDKITVLEERYANLIANAHENEQLNNKMHAFFVSLQQAQHFNALNQVVSNQLPETFSIAGTCLRIWATPIDRIDSNNLVLKKLPEDTQYWVNHLDKVYCGVIPDDINIDDWFTTSVKSIVVIPLKSKSTFGFLALASEESGRFYAEMGTDFLQKLAEHVSAAFSRYVIHP